MPSGSDSIDKKHIAEKSYSARSKGRVVALLAVLCNLGCGYHTAGHSVQIPQNVKTIAIPAFKNETRFSEKEKTQ